MTRRHSILVLAVFGSGCFHFFPHYTMLTQPQVEERGARTYGHTTVAKAADAFEVGLKTLGYEVTVKQAENGLIKTAPKVMVRSATAYGSEYSAAANEKDEALAWTIKIEASSHDVVVHATPHAFVNGTERHDENIWCAEYLDPWFRDVWSQVDDLLGKPVQAFTPPQLQAAR